MKKMKKNSVKPILPNLPRIAPDEIVTDHLSWQYVGPVKSTAHLRPSWLDFPNILHYGQIGLWNVGHPRPSRTSSNDLVSLPLRRAIY